MLVQYIHVRILLSVLTRLYTTTYNILTTGI